MVSRVLYLRWMSLALFASFSLCVLGQEVRSQQCDPESGLPPGEVILGPRGEQFSPENTTCPDPIAAPECPGGLILRYVDPADPDRLVRYACVGFPPGGSNLPLLIHFHGSHEFSADENFSGFEGNPPKTNLLAQVNFASLAPGKAGYVLLMPQGRCITAPPPPHGDGSGMHFDEWYKDPQNNLDVRATQAFIQQLLDRVTLDEQGNPLPLPQTFPTIDPSRIYLNGISNGAFFAHLLGLMFPNQFAAIATAAGADPFARGPCPVPYPPTSRKIPVMVVHAACDPVVLCDCRGCDSAEATVAQWFKALSRRGWSDRLLNNRITNTDHTRAVPRCRFKDIDRQRLCPRSAHDDYPNPQTLVMFSFLKRFSLRR